MTVGSNANEGFWSLIYAMGDVYPNKELDEKEMKMGMKAFRQRVKSIFRYFPKLVRYMNVILFVCLFV